MVHNPPRLAITSKVNNASPTNPNSKDSLGVIAGAGIGSVAFIVGVIVLFCIYRKRRNNQEPMTPQKTVKQDIGDKAQLHSQCRIIHELSLSLRRLPELMGLRRQGVEVVAQERRIFELPSEIYCSEFPAVEPVGSVLSGQKKLAEGQLCCSVTSEKNR